MVVWRRFSGVALNLLNAIDGLLRQHEDLSLAELRLLLQLRSAGEPQRMVDLAEGLEITKAGATKMVGRLEQKGFLQRQACVRDGRAKQVELTESGAAALQASHPKLVRWLSRHFLDVFDEEELALLNRALLKLIVANQMDDPADRD